MKNIDVSIIMGSDSDLPIMKDCAKFLEQMGISYEMKILSVHRTPEKATEYAKELKEFFVRLREAMDNLDMDAMEDAVKDMDIYSYSGEHKEFYEDIKNAVEDIDIEQCEEIIGKWEESLQ